MHQGHLLRALQRCVETVVSIWKREKTRQNLASEWKKVEADTLFRSDEGKVRENIQGLSYTHLQDTRCT